LTIAGGVYACTGCHEWCNERPDELCDECKRKRKNERARERYAEDKGRLAAVRRGEESPRSVGRPREPEPVATMEDRLVALERRAAELQHEANGLRDRLVEVMRDATSLWTTCGALAGEVWSLKRKDAA